MNVLSACRYVSLVVRVLQWGAALPRNLRPALGHIHVLQAPLRRPRVVLKVG